MLVSAKKKYSQRASFRNTKSAMSPRSVADASGAQAAGPRPQRAPSRPGGRTWCVWGAHAWMRAASAVRGAQPKWQLQGSKWRALFCCAPRQSRHTNEKRVLGCTVEPSALGDPLDCTAQPGSPDDSVAFACFGPVTSRRMGVGPAALITIIQVPNSVAVDPNPLCVCVCHRPRPGDTSTSLVGKMPNAEWRP